MRKNHSTTTQTSVTRFAVGQTYITPGAEEALMIAGQTAIEFLRRHMSCDWGELSEDDIAAMRTQLSRSDISDEDRLHLHFALAKALANEGCKVALDIA